MMRLLFVSTILSICICAGVWADQADQAGHWLIHVSQNGQKFTITQALAVKSAIPKRRDSSRVYPWRYAVVDKDGRVLFERGMEDPGIVRGEFSDSDGKIEGHRLRKDGIVVFSVRIPPVTASRIVFYAVRPGVTRMRTLSKNDYEEIGSVAYPIE